VECVGVTKGVMPSAEAGPASSRIVRLSSARSSSPSPPVPLELRNSPASVFRHIRLMPSSSNLTVASRPTVPKEAGTAPLRTRVAVLSQSCGNRSGSPHQTTRGPLASLQSPARSRQPMPDDEPQTLTGTVPLILDTTAAGGLVKYGRMAHAGPEGPKVPPGHLAAAPLNISRAASSSCQGGLLRATTFGCSRKLCH
jgi:hypothetical protein